MTKQKCNSNNVKTILKEGAKEMSQRKRTAIKQGAMMDVMSHLSNLPNREPDPSILLGLSEIFHTKEYMTKIKGALKKGYTFDDLAEIFSDRCGGSINGRQLKYHYTRAMSLAAKRKSGGKSTRPNPAKNSGKIAEKSAISSSKSSDFVSRRGVAENAQRDESPDGKKA